MTADLDSPHLPDLEEMRRQFVDIQNAEDKYVYFLLAIAAGAIAYAMQRTSASALHPIDAVLGLAILCWGGSFWAGCQNRGGRLLNAQTHFWNEAMKTAFRADATQDPTNPHLSEAKELVTKFVQGLDQTASKASQSAHYWFGCQFWLLVTGAVFCFLWHVAGMASRTAV